MDAEIAKDIPLPSPAYHTRRKYPFDTLQVGESFWVLEASYRVRTAANYFAKRYNKKFKVRTENYGARCWRIA